MPVVRTWIALCIIVALVAFTVHGQSPVPPAPQLTIERLKAKIADLTLENDILREYNQTLITKIVEMDSELKKLKEGPAKP